MMKKRIFLAGALAVFSLTACRGLIDPDNSPVTRGEFKLASAKIDQEKRLQMDNFNMAAMDFYEETADAYYILGYEYYRLAKVLQESGKKEQSDNYFKLAMVYREQQRDLESLAQKRRLELSPQARARLEPVMGAASQPAQAKATGEKKVSLAATPSKASE